MGARYGKEFLEATSSSVSGTLRIAYVPDVFLVEIPAGQQLCARTSDCGKVIFCGRESNPSRNSKRETTFQKKKLDVQFRISSAHSHGCNLQTVAQLPSAEIVRALNKLYPFRCLSV